MEATMETAGPWEDLGSGVRVRRVTESGTGALVGLDFSHACAGRTRPSIEWLPFSGSRLYSCRSWIVAVTPSLTVRPRIECARCGHSGSITDGAWVPE